MFTPKIGEDEPKLTFIFFSNGLKLNHQLVNHDVIRGHLCSTIEDRKINLSWFFACQPALAWRRSRSILEDWLELRFVCGWIWAVLLSKVNQDIAPLLLSYFANCLLSFSLFESLCASKWFEFEENRPNHPLLTAGSTCLGMGIPTQHEQALKKCVFFPQGFHSAGKTGDPPINHSWRCFFWNKSFPKPRSDSACFCQ